MRKWALEYCWWQVWESFFGRTVGQYDLEYLTNEKYSLTLSFLGFFISKWIEYACKNLCICSLWKEGSFYQLICVPPFLPTHQPPVLSLHYRWNSENFGHWPTLCFFTFLSTVNKLASYHLFNMISLGYNWPDYSFSWARHQPVLIIPHILLYLIIGISCCSVHSLQTVLESSSL